MIAQVVTAICLGAMTATVTVGLGYLSIWIWHGERPEVV